MIIVLIMKAKIKKKNIIFKVGTIKVSIRCKLNIIYYDVAVTLSIAFFFAPRYIPIIIFDIID